MTPKDQSANNPTKGPITIINTRQPADQRTTGSNLAAPDL